MIVLFLKSRSYLCTKILLFIAVSSHYRRIIYYCKLLILGLHYYDILLLTLNVVIVTR